MIDTVIFDIDGTLLDSRQAAMSALMDIAPEVHCRAPRPEEVDMLMGMTSRKALEYLGAADPVAGCRVWGDRIAAYAGMMGLFPGVERLVRRLKSEGYGLGVITSRTRLEYETDFVPCGLGECFDYVVCVGEGGRPKPSPDPMLYYLSLSGARKESALYIGDTVYDMRCAAGAGVAFGLAVWGAGSVEGISADYYFSSPESVCAALSLDCEE